MWTLPYGRPCLAPFGRGYAVTDESIRTVLEPLGVEK